jgi:heme iron utilization protein
MDESEKLKQILGDILISQRFAVLCSIDNTQPYSNLVAFAASDDLKYLVFITDRNTRKFKNMVENRQVSLLVDSRTNQPIDINNAIAITVLGSASENDDKNHGFPSLYLAKHSHLNQFANEPNNALIVVTVSEYIIADFNNVHRIVMKS